MVQRSAHDFPWTAAQRRALITFLIILMAITIWREFRRGRNIDDPPVSTAAHADALADRLDPNTAEWQELAAIPGLGEKKAKAIVAFREQFIKSHGNGLAFRVPDDLRRIKGIGPATVMNLRPFLVFAGDPATQP